MTTSPQPSPSPTPQQDNRRGSPLDGPEDHDAPGDQDSSQQSGEPAGRMTVHQGEEQIVQHGGEQADAEGPSREAISAAARELSAVAEARWVQISSRVITGAMTTPRRSLPIRAEADSGPVHVSENALITLIRAALDGHLERCALQQVHLQVSHPDTLQGVTLLLVAQYGQPLLPMADRARELTLQVLRDTLGTVTPPVTVSTLWMHFDDVTLGDPNFESD